MLLLLVCFTDAQTLSGTVTYNSRTVSGVTITAVSPQGTLVTTTNFAGQYVLNLTPGRVYTVTPSKVTANTSISSYDAALVAMYVVGAIQFAPRQIAAADVSGDGVVSSYDAALIHRYVVGLPGGQQTGQWKFTPASRVYSALGHGTLDQQDFKLGK